MNQPLYFKPASAVEAAALLDEHPGAVVIGGGAFVRLRSRRIPVAVDLFDAGLDYVRQTDAGLELGAMATFRMLETDPLVAGFADGLLARAVERIVGVQMRNITTVGGTLYGRYGFSNLITALLALDAEVQLLRGGLMPLEKFFTTRPDPRDILTRVVLPRVSWRAGWQDLTRTVNDYAVLNTAVATGEGRTRVVVGARPGRGTRCPQAEKVLIAGGPAAAEQAGEAAAAELEFADDVRASADYRRAVCRTLVTRAAGEVLS